MKLYHLIFVALFFSSVVVSSQRRCITAYVIFVSLLIPFVRVAVVGSGIGGASLAFFLRENLGENVAIDIYEQRDEAGGHIGETLLDEKVCVLTNLLNDKVY